MCGQTKIIHFVKISYLQLERIICIFNDSSVMLANVSNTQLNGELCYLVTSIGNDRH